ncbi:MAG: portal protein, partial [Desulfovibrionaceae bacterium]
MSRHVPNDSDELASEILQRFSELERQREPYHALWEDIASCAGPSFGGFGSDKEHPIEPDAEVVDTTLRRSAAVLSSGLLSFLSSPSQRWFRLSHPDPEAADDKQVRVWLQRV